MEHLTGVLVTSAILVAMGIGVFAIVNFFASVFSKSKIGIGFTLRSPRTLVLIICAYLIVVGLGIDVAIPKPAGTLAQIAWQSGGLNIALFFFLLMLFIAPPLSDDENEYVNPLSRTLSWYVVPAFSIIIPLAAIGISILIAKYPYINLNVASWYMTATTSLAVFFALYVSYLASSPWPEEQWGARPLPKFSMRLFGHVLKKVFVS